MYFSEQELYYSKNNIIEKMGYSSCCEMTDFEQAFLGGLIKKRRPKKILEVGVAAGATTASIVNMISELEIDGVMYSVDLNQHYYRDSAKKTGYIYDEIQIPLRKDFRHYFMLGKYLPEVIDVIGNEIDFVILDTVHSLPGELLDFLVVYPYLSKDATVVIHDISLNCYSSSNVSYATKLLFDVVKGKKIISKDPKKPFEIPNIAAFEINDNTKDSLTDVFSSLTISWNYLPTYKEELIYTNFYRKHYIHYMNLWDDVIGMQKMIAIKKYKSSSYDECIEKIKEADNIYIYGNGTIGRAFRDVLLTAYGISVTAFIVSNKNDANDNSDVVGLEDIIVQSKDCIIMTINNKKSRELITSDLKNKGYEVI